FPTQPSWRLHPRRRQRFPSTPLHTPQRRPNRPRRHQLRPANWDDFPYNARRIPSNLNPSHNQRPQGVLIMHSISKERHLTTNGSTAYLTRHPAGFYYSQPALDALFSLPYEEFLTHLTPGTYAHVTPSIHRYIDGVWTCIKFSVNLSEPLPVYPTQSVDHYPDYNFSTLIVHNNGDAFTLASYHKSDFELRRPIYPVSCVATPASIALDRLSRSFQ